MKKTLVYQPRKILDFDGGKIMIGGIGKITTKIENLPPEDNFDETKHIGWRAAHVFIDTRDFSDGQKIAFQIHPNVGTPLPITASLIHHINSENKDFCWNISANLITEESAFWNAVKVNNEKITSLTLSFESPNVLQLKNSISKELERAKKTHNASQITMKLENSDNNLKLDEKNEELQDSITYISEGAGRAQLHAGRKKLFDSNAKTKPQEIEVFNGKNNLSLESIASKLFKRRGK